MQLIHQQEMWVPTVQGWLLTLSCVTALMLLLRTYIYPFLALNRPIEADVLVIEGWIEDHALKEVMQEFERGNYQKLITIGPSLSQGHPLAQYKTYAELSAATLIALGFPSDKLAVVPTPNVPRNRTDAYAVALREWIAAADLQVKAINLYTFDVHSRRSWLIFQRTFAPEIKVGTLVLKPLNYDAKQWWMSSAGVKAIILETISYIYACFVDWRA